MLVRGDRLSPETRKHVLAAYVHRWTRENSHQGFQAERQKLIDAGVTQRR